MTTSAQRQRLLALASIYNSDFMSSLLVIFSVFMHQHSWPPWGFVKIFKILTLWGPKILSPWSSSSYPQGYNPHLHKIQSQMTSSQFSFPDYLELQTMHPIFLYPIPLSLLYVFPSHLPPRKTFYIQ
jgi:hypothetical protein